MINPRRAETTVAWTLLEPKLTAARLWKRWASGLLRFC